MKNLEVYTNHFSDFEYVYYLNKKGRELIGSEKIVTKTLQYQHTLMKNDIYVHFEMPKNWMNEYTIPTKEFKIVADAIFQADKVYFLEVDNMQKMKENYNKIDKYKKFKEMGLWQQENHGHFPTLLFYTTKDSRQHQLREYCKTKELTHLVLTKEDLH
jgi:Replication-relaxation